MNKQNLLLTTLLLTISTMAFAQDLSFGIRGGLNVANLSMDAPPYYVNGGANINSKETRKSFNLGVYSQQSLNDKMALQAELFYSGEGASFTNPGTEMPQHIKLNYLSLPLFFRYSIIQNFYVMAGPQFSYLLAAHSVYANGTSYDALDEHKKIGVGFVPVIGYDWKKFSINLRYQIGLTGVPKSNPSSSMTRYSDDKVKSNVFSIVVSYKVFSVKVKE